MKLFKMLLLSKEASLFDTKEFVIKAFVAVILGAVVGKIVPYVGKDMISVLFGMILTLEPVNMTGIRNGFGQVRATIFGAIITGIILSIFGYTILTTAFAIAATLYVSLLVNWREFPVVAVFTSIYMTQYIQTNSLGEPSVLATFQLRIIALLTGVSIALLMNWLFSVIGYRHMIEKRLYYLLEDLEKKMRRVGDMIEKREYDKVPEIMNNFAPYFSELNWIQATIVDYKKDPFVIGKNKKIKKLNELEKMAERVREMAHLIYDYMYRAPKESEIYESAEFMEAYRKSLNALEELSRSMNKIIHDDKVVNTWDINQVSDVSQIKLLNSNIQQLGDLILDYGNIS